MRTARRRSHDRLVIVLATLVLAACSDETPLASTEYEGAGARALTAELNRFLATVRQATARYHNLSTALADGFVALHPCEERPGEGPAGALYVHFANLLDGVIDPKAPDALLYEPSHNGRMKLVGVEFAIPYAMWTEAEPPSLFGETFQPEDEFGVWALHVWVWRHNPEGMFAESNPNVSCAAD